jgi:hypothetical protein
MAGTEAGHYPFCRIDETTSADPASTLCGVDWIAGAGPAGTLIRHG